MIEHLTAVLVLGVVIGVGYIFGLAAGDHQEVEHRAVVTLTALTGAALLFGLYVVSAFLFG